MELNNIFKKYGDKVIFDKFSHKFNDGEITVILGESGVGKTTLISIIAGLTEFSGEVKDAGKISCTFQNDRLIDTLSVKENLLIVNRDIDVDRVLSSVDMLDARDLMPRTLSAGMSRRVAILRALNYPSDTLLMDEPLRNLDYAMKYRIMDEIIALNKKNGNTIIIVTHDIKEAVYLADNIIILKSINGKCEKIEVDNITEQALLDVMLK